MEPPIWRLILTTPEAAPVSSALMCAMPETVNKLLDVLIDIINGNKYNHDIKTIRIIRFFNKKEEIYRDTYRTFEEANIAIFKYIEGWYNRKRLHSALNYMTSNQYELLVKSAT